MKASIVKNTLPVLIITVAALVSATSAIAHHSFGSTYDVQKEITVEGKVVQVSLRSPHSFVFVEAPDENGKIQRWAFEGAAAAQFAQQGVTGTNGFKIGDPVKVSGNPARAPGSFRARLVKIVRTTDGKSWGGRAGETVQ